MNSPFENEKTSSAIPVIEIDESVYDKFDEFTVNPDAISEYMRELGIPDRDIKTTSIEFVTSMPDSKYTKHGVKHPDGTTRIDKKVMIAVGHEKRFTWGMSEDESELIYVQNSEERINHIIAHELNHIAFAWGDRKLPTSFLSGVGRLKNEAVIIGSGLSGGVVAEVLFQNDKASVISAISLSTVAFARKIKKDKVREAIPATDSWSKDPEEIACEEAARENSTQFIFATLPEQWLK